jgi:hypothetical protein
MVPILLGEIAHAKQHRTTMSSLQASIRESSGHSVTTHFSGWERHESFDADEQALRLRGWNQCYDQISPGAHCGVTVNAHLGDFQLFREFSSTALRQRGLAPGETHTFAVRIDDGDEARFRGSTLTRHSLLNMSQGVELGRVDAYPNTALGHRALVASLKDADLALAQPFEQIGAGSFRTMRSLRTSVAGHGVRCCASESAASSPSVGTVRGGKGEGGWLMRTLCFDNNGSIAHRPQVCRRRSPSDR